MCGTHMQSSGHSLSAADARLIEASSHIAMSHNIGETIKLGTAAVMLKFGIAASINSRLCMQSPSLQALPLLLCQTSAC